MLSLIRPALNGLPAVATLGALLCALVSALAHAEGARCVPEDMRRIDHVRPLVDSEDEAGALALAYRRALPSANVREAPMQTRVAAQKSGSIWRVEIFNVLYSAPRAKSIEIIDVRVGVCEYDGRLMYMITPP